MNLIVEIDESVLRSVVKQSVTDFLVWSTYPHEHRGAIAKYVAGKTEVALREEIDKLDMNEIVRDHFNQYLQAVVENVVRREIERIARKCVKDMRDKGELLKSFNLSYSASSGD